MINESKLQKQNKDKRDALNNADDVINEIIQGFFILSCYFISKSMIHTATFKSIHAPHSYASYIKKPVVTYMLQTLNFAAVTTGSKHIMMRKMLQ